MFTLNQQSMTQILKIGFSFCAQDILGFIRIQGTTSLSLTAPLLYVTCGVKEQNRYEVRNTRYEDVKVILFSYLVLLTSYLTSLQHTRSPHSHLSAVGLLQPFHGL